MSLDPTKGYQALRRGRTSEAGFSYFITFCTEQRLCSLLLDDIARVIADECQAMQSQDVWTIRCGTIMPDHIHLLIELGPKLSLGKTVARLKARTAASLRKSGLRWQSGYFEHRLRPKEDILPYFLYTYFNPYRAGLASSTEQWPWFICNQTDRE